MDEETAWACFMRTGSVRDYLVYSQSKRSGRAKQAARQTACPPAFSPAWEQAAPAL